MEAAKFLNIKESKIQLQRQQFVRESDQNMPPTPIPPLELKLQSSPKQRKVRFHEKVHQSVDQHQQQPDKHSDQGLTTLLERLKQDSAKALETDSTSMESSNLHTGSCFASYTYVDATTESAAQQRYIKIQDNYGNVFNCREGPEKHLQTTVDNDTLSMLRQPLLTTSSTANQWDELITHFGISITEESECRGIDYVDFRCPIGTEDRIALFYDSVLYVT